MDPNNPNNQNPTPSPATPQPPPTSASASTPQPTNPSSLDQTKPNENKKLLIVEDEPFIADLYQHVLTNAGFKVQAVNDGKTALDTLGHDTFDVMLLDIMMPGMNGLEVLRQWKVKNPHSGMIIILLTNLGQDSVIKEGFDLGAQGYLIKSSMTPEQVATEVSNAIKNASPQPA